MLGRFCSAIGGGMDSLEPGEKARLPIIRFKGDTTRETIFLSGLGTHFQVFSDVKRDF